MEKNNPYTMKAVVRRTGLSPHVIRVWEKRYGVVNPKRSPTNRRLYSESDIERLRLLRRAVESGHSIGQVHDLPLTDLKRLIQVADRLGFKVPDERGALNSGEVIDNYLETCLAATVDLNPGALEEILTRASIEFSRPFFLQRIVIPLLRVAGDRWQDGSFKIFHEHMVSSVVRTFLGHSLVTQSVPAGAPSIVVGTPAGQMHELGALLAGVTAITDGWNVTYLGPNLPAEELAAIAIKHEISVVALSILYPPDDPKLPGELRLLRSNLPDRVHVCAGGQAAESYGSVLRELGVEILKDLTDFRDWLASIRISNNRNFSKQMGQGEKI